MMRYFFHCYCLRHGSAAAEKTLPCKPKSLFQNPSAVDDRVHSSNEQADEKPYLGDDCPAFEELYTTC